MFATDKIAPFYNCSSTLNLQAGIQRTFLQWLLTARLCSGGWCPLFLGNWWSVVENGGEDGGGQWYFMRSLERRLILELGGSWQGQGYTIIRYLPRLIFSGRYKMRSAVSLTRLPSQFWLPTILCVVGAYNLPVVGLNTCRSYPK